MVSTGIEYSLLSAILNGSSNRATLLTDAEAIDGPRRLVSIVRLLALITTGVSVLRWIYRSNSNLHATASVPIEFSPGWAVGWFFVPIAYLWKPYQAMKEIWRASFDPVGKQVKVSALLPWWWFFWLASNFFGVVTFRLSLSKDLSALVASIGASFASAAADVPAALLLAIIIARVTQAQTRLPNATSVF